jgi:hypothetical protein
MTGAVAQLVARLVRNEEVRGSIPLSSTKSVLLKLLDQLFVSAVDSSTKSFLLKPWSLHLFVSVVDRATEFTKSALIYTSASVIPAILEKFDDDEK